MDGIEPPCYRFNGLPATNGTHQLNVPCQRDIPDNKALFGMLLLNLGKLGNGLFGSGGVRPAETPICNITID